MTKQTQKKRKGFFGITARALLLSAAGLLVMSYLSMIANPAEAWFMTFFGLLFVPSFALNLLLLLWGLRRRSKALLIPLVALIPSFFLMGRYLQLSSPETPEDKHGVKVVSYNVGKFDAGKEGGKKIQIDACTDSVVNYLKNLDADIICIQEFRLPAETDIDQYLKKHFPGYHREYFMFTGQWISFGNVTLSKYPIKDKGRIQFDRSVNLAIYTDLDIDGAKVRIYNCHFESYGISIPKIASDIKNSKDDEVKEAEEKIIKSIKMRPSQVQEVISDIENSPREAIVLGDFNDTPLSYTYHHLCKGREDSFVKAGKGFGASYSILWPFIRIDYVLYPERFNAIRNAIPHVKFSDHYPVIAEIDFSTDK